MKKNFIYLLLLCSLIAQAQVTPSYPTIKLTKTVEGVKQDSLLVVGTDKIVKHIPASKLGTVKSVTGTDGISVANGTTNPVIGISSISQLKIAGLVTDLSNKVDKVTGKSLIADSEIIRLSTVTNQDISSKANDVDVVHKTGNETKSGILTLSDGLKLTGNTTSTTATKLNVQETDGTINTISKSDLVNVVEVNTVPFLPLIGEAGKIYVVKNLNKIYRWNGTIYQELAVTDISGKLNLINAKQAGAVGDGITDDTTVLQSYLNNGQGTYLFPKSDYIVSGLNVKSNSKLIFEKGARLILKNNSDRPVLQNINFSLNVDKNIEIYGLEIEGNEANQIKIGVSSPYIGEPTSGLRFFGVENLKIIDTKINKAKTYGIWVSRIKNGVFKNIEFNQSLLAVANQDGLHVNGLCENLDISNMSGVTNDDMIALNADDVAQGSNVSLGAITNAIIRNVVFNNNLNGIRLLSGTSRLDKITVENLSGSVRDNVVAISSYGLGIGNFGSITIDNVKVDTNTPINVMGEYGGYILVNDKVEYLKISNVYRRTGADARPTVRIQSRADISKIIIDNSTTVINPSLTTFYPDISFENGSKAHQVFLSNLRLLNGVFPNGYQIGATGSVITRLHLDNIYSEQIGYGLYLNNTDISTLFVNTTNTNFIRYPFYLVNDSDIAFADIKNSGWFYSAGTPNVYNILDTSSIVFPSGFEANSIVKYDDNFNLVKSSLKEVGSELSNTSTGNGAAIDLNKTAGFGSTLTLRNSSVLSNALIRLHKPDNVNFYNIYTSSTGLETDGSVTAPTFNGSATLTGTPTAPTAAAGTNTTQIATTAFVTSADSGNVKLTGDQNISGLKTFTNSSSNSSGIYSYNTSTGDGIYSENIAGGVGLHLNNFSGGNNIVSNNSSTGTGFNYVGENNGLTTYTVDKFGIVTANSFIKTGGTAAQFLKADGSVDESDVVKNIVKEATQGANVTGTVSETILYSKLIPANTLKNGDFMTLFSRIARPSPTASSGGVDQRVRINTSNTLTGSIIIAKNLLTAGAFGNQVGTLERTFNVTNGYLIGFTTSFNSNTDIQNSNGSPQFNLFNPTIDNYIFITGQLANSADTMYHLGTKITN